jgi:DNA-binding GntR family transcriptional regulator
MGKSGKRTVDRVYEELLDRIVRGVLAPGTRIVEREIAERLGVSRTPVREAVWRLQNEGLLVANPAEKYARPTVAALTEDDARELHDLVARLEAVTARRAAELPVDRREAIVRELVSRNRAFLEGSEVKDASPGELVELDHAFHAVYVQAVAGPRLMALRKAAKPQIARYAWNYASYILKRIPESVAEHEAIIDAIRDGDPDRAEQAVLDNWHHAAGRVHKAIMRAGERGGW